MTDLDDRIRAVVVELVEAAPPAPPFPDAQASPSGRRRVGLPLLVVSACAVVAMVVVAALALSSPHRQRVAATGRGGGEVRVAAPPLMRTLPPTTGTVEVLRGTAAGVPWPWSLTARLRGGDSAATDGPPAQFCVNVTFEAPPGNAAALGGGTCGDPHTMLSLTSAQVGPGTGLQVRMLLGVTSAPAAKIRVDTGPDQAPLLLNPVTTAAFPGLRFFAADASAVTVGRITALAADGSPLLRTADPEPTGVPTASDCPAPRREDQPLVAATDRLDHVAGDGVNERIEPPGSQQPRISAPAALAHVERGFLISPVDAVLASWIDLRPGHSTPRLVWILRSRVLLDRSSGNGSVWVPGNPPPTTVTTTELWVCGETAAIVDASTGQSLEILTGPPIL